MLILSPWVRHYWLIFWNWLHLIRLNPRRIEENNGHAEGLYLRQPISQESGAGNETATAQDNNWNRAIGKTDAQNEVVVELERRNAELIRQLEKTKKYKEYYKNSKRQSSLQIGKLVQQNLALEDQVNLLENERMSLQIENSDLKTKLEEANNKTLENKPQDDTMAVG